VPPKKRLVPAVSVNECGKQHIVGKIGDKHVPGTNAVICLPSTKGFNTTGFIPRNPIPFWLIDARNCKLIKGYFKIFETCTAGNQTEYYKTNAMNGEKNARKEHDLEIATNHLGRKQRRYHRQTARYNYLEQHLTLRWIQGQRLEI